MEKALFGKINVLKIQPFLVENDLCLYVKK